MSAPYHGPSKPATPVGDSEADAILAGLAGFPLVVLAVSGGADSMALLHLVSCWRVRSAGPKPRILVATVDHRLRPGSDREAAWVGQEAAARGLAHRTLVWSGARPATGIQEAARDARYALLLHAARAEGVTPAAIVTAHTEDDQGETFLMRLARGSGLDGLAAMAPQRPLDDSGSYQLVRPLLGIAKDRLVTTLEASSVTWLEDPSNDCTDFERVRLRGARPLLAGIGLDSAGLARSARRLLRAREALDQATDAVIRSSIDLNRGIFADVDRTSFLALPEELRIRVLMRLLAAFGGAARPPRLAQIEDLVRDFAHAPATGWTLGGCQIAAAAGRLAVYREPARAGFESFPLQPGETRVWDGRFRVELAAPHEESGGGVAARRRTPGIEVRALGAKAYATLRHDCNLTAGPPARAAATVPAFWQGEAIVAVPQLAALCPQLAGPSEAGSVICRSDFVGLRDRRAGA